MKENVIWKEHPFLKGLFCSTEGEILLPESGTHKSHKLFGHKHYKKGYLIIVFKKKHYMAHRLIAETFIPNPDNYPTVDHINRVRDDNRVENLRWASYKMQMKNITEYDWKLTHSKVNWKEVNAKKDYNKITEKYKKPVCQLTKSGVLIKEYKSASDAARELGFIVGGITHCCRGDFDTYKGFVWRYK